MLRTGRNWKKRDKKEYCGDKNNRLLQRNNGDQERILKYNKKVKSQ